MNWLGWSLLSALFAGITAVLAKAGMAHMNSHLATAIRTTVVLVFVWMIAALNVRTFDLTSVHRRAWLFLVFSGAATGLSWLCYFRALQLGTVAKVSSIDKLSLPIAIVLSCLLLGERLGWRETGGVVLIVAGALVLAWK